jgi:hypothetical protein
MRTCSKCGQQAKPYAQYCACGEGLPSTYSNRHPRTQRGQKRARAEARMLEDMRAPACKACGLRGMHECIQTADWKAETISILASRQI